MRSLTRRFLDRLAEERGGVLVLVALSSAAILAFSALAIDLGMLITARSEAQRAADSLALAGASAYLDFDPLTKPVEAKTEGNKRVMDYATQNAIRGTVIDTATEVKDTFMLSEYKVRVTVTRKAIPLWFARIFGIQTWDVSAAATAEAALAGTTDCVKPFMIPDMWEEGGVAAGGVGDDTVKANGIWDFDKDIGCTGNSCHPETWHFNDGDVYSKPTVVNGQPSGSGTGYGTDTRNGTTLDTIRTWMPNCNVVSGCIAGTGNQPQKYTKPSGITYNQDNGRRIPLKVQIAQGGNVESFWFPWVIPGASNSGVAAITAAIQGCVPLDQIAVGENLELDAETKNGLSPQPIKTAIDSLISLDPQLYWDEATNQPAYPPGVNKDWEASPRVFTIVIFDPSGLREGKQYYPVVNFGRFMLENPDSLYPDVKQDFNRPITGRLIKFARGGSGPQKGTLIRTLRLVK